MEKTGGAQKDGPQEKRQVAVGTCGGRGRQGIEGDVIPGNVEEFSDKRGAEGARDEEEEVVHAHPDT